MNTRELLVTAWNWNPIVIGVCVLALVAYARTVGIRRERRAWLFIGSVVLFFLTLASPVNALADGYLFSAHMLQHLLLLLVIPPLLLMGLPEWNPERAAVTRQGGGTMVSRGAGRIFKKRIPPFATWLAGLSAMWVWHERTLCDLATTTQSWRVIQIISLLVLGTLFWWPIVGPQTDRRLPPLLGVLYLFSACVGCTVLGILITFAPVGAVCPVYLHPVDRLGILPLIRDGWGITPGIDQQAGGLMMWVPACTIYVSGVIALLARWYRAGESVDAAPPFRAPGLPGVPSPNPKQHNA